MLISFPLLDYMMLICVLNCSKAVVVCILLPDNKIPQNIFKKASKTPVFDPAF